ncbi:MAG TPA: LuxR C-terminal-related transcriptional regulator [Ktedonobacteraceae bacterium]|jgi:LuxR family maltose regulon positive regulatory protein|nr:LuxR C-terminal-related transcriptional regulator [Ktedonobacteraceae bacterium]
MPKSAQYVISWFPEQRAYLVNEQGNGAAIAVPEGESWRQWLGEHRSFAFHGRNGQINVLKEKRSRGGDDYWYAYQRHGKQMLKRYAGRSAQLSMERLEEIAALLAMGEDEATRENTQAERTASIINPAQFEPLLVTKLQLPRMQKSLLRREHLWQALDKGLDYRLTVISGPAGYGKTTAVAQWITERSSHPDFPRVAYIALDEGDNDPIRFWRYVIAACQKFQAGFGKEALDLLLASRLPPFEALDLLLASRIPPFKPLDMMITVMLNELSQLEQPCVLILDDFHVIDAQQIRETLSFFLEHLPISLHLLLLVRGESALSLTRMRARNQLLDIYPPYLGFSLEETGAFFKQELPFTLSTKLLREIYERLEGWPTGIRLLASRLQTAESEQEVEHMLASFTGSHWSLQDYFFQEVVRTLPQELQAFLLQTSVLPRLTAALCDVVLEREDSAKMLEALHNSDLFIIPLDATGEWGRYQTLFSEAMQQEARKRLGEERLRKIAEAASQWYEQHNYPVEAIETALNASAFRRAANLIQQYVESKQQSSTPTIPELYDLKWWLERLPEEELERKPDLCVQYAMILLFTLMENPRLTQPKERIYQLLQVAEQKWRDANNTAKLAEVFSFRSMLARQEGKMLQAVTWAKESLAWLPPENRIWRTIALTVVGFGETRDGNLKLARKYLLEALILSEQQGNRLYARASRGMLSWVSSEQGELHSAAEQFRQLQAEARMQEDYDDVARTQLGLAQIHYQWNQLEEAKEATQEALAIGERMGMEDFLALGTAKLALIEHAESQTAQARQRLLTWLAGRTMPQTPHSYHLYREVQATLARLYLATGDLLSVERWFESIEQREETLPRTQRQHEQLLKARFLLAQQETEEAIEQLEQLSAATQATGHSGLQREAQAILVLAYFQQGRRERWKQQLLELLATTRSENYLRLYLDLGEEMAERLRELLPCISDKTLLSYARRILAAFDKGTGASDAKAGEAVLLEPLSAQEQKVLRLLAAGNSNAEIARELVVSVNTIRTQVQSIYRKLNVNNRVEASEAARKLGLV